MKKIKMSRKLKRMCGLGFCLVFVIIVVFMEVGGNSGGRFDRAQTGCTCHDDPNPNPDPSVIITLSGLPAQYTPTNTYSLTIEVSGGPATPRGGYNLEVSAGTLTNPGPNSQLNVALDQATHNTDAVRSWTVDWIAPGSGTGTVTFWIAGLAAGDPANANGDLWNLYNTTVPELVVANNPPEAQDLTVQGFGDGTVGIAHITDHTPDLGWSFYDQDGGDTQQEYDVRVGTGSGLSDMWALGPQSGAASSVVYAGSTLLDDTNYWFGVRVNDGADWSVWNETQFHMNSLEARGLTVQDFADGTTDIMHITDHFPYLNWSFWDGEADSQQQYEVRVGSASGLSDMWAPGAQAGAANTETYAGLALLDSTDYWFGIRVHDGYEWNPWNETQFHMNSVEAQGLTVQGYAEATSGIMHITDHTPDLGWTFWDNEADSQQQYEVRVGTALGLSDMWAPGIQVGATNVETYAGLTLVDGTDYWFGIRVFDGYEWSAWDETQFHMNSLSEAIDLAVQGFSSGTNNIMHITDHTPDLSWLFSDIDSGDIQQQYEVRVGTASSLSDMWAPGIQIGATPVETYAGLTLVDGTDYWFGIRVFDGYEWSVWNETQFHINTLSIAETLTVQGYDSLTPEIDHITDHTPDLGWLFFDGDVDAQQQYEIRVGTASGASDMWAPGVQIGAANFDTYAGSALLNGNDYWFGIRVYDGYEWGAWNETQFHMNSIETRSLTVQGFASGTSGIMHISDQNPDLGWSLWDEEGDSQQQYEVRVGTAPGLSDMWAPGIQIGATNVETYAGLALDDGADYWFGTRVFDGYEWSVWNETQFHMNYLSEAKNLSVQGFSSGTIGVIHITDHTPELNWLFSDLDDGDAQQMYEIRVGTSSGQSDMWAPGQLVGPTNTVTYGGLPLLDGENYFFSIRVFDGYEWSLWNETQFHMNTLSAPQNLTVQGFQNGTPGIEHITDHTPDLGWLFFDADGDSQLQYEITVGTSSGLSDMWAPGIQFGGTNSITYNGATLIDGADYWFGIRVYDGYEWSQFNETMFHMNSLPPAPIPPLSPLDDSNIPSSPAQTLSWTSGGTDSEGDTITYYWYVDVGNPPSAPYIANGITTGTSSAPFATSPATGYYWYINDTDGWEWNSTIIWNFTTSALVNNPPEAQNLTVQDFFDGTIGIMHITDHTPDLNWSFFDPDGGDSQQEYEVKVGSGPGLSDMWAPGSQVGGTISQTYAGLILQDGVDYWFGIRVYDGNTWSVWNETQFHVNSMEAQSLTVQGYAEGTPGIMHITDHFPYLNWSFWDGEADSQQQYEIRVGTASGLSDMWSLGSSAGASSSEIYSGPTLLDGTSYWFGVRVYDGYEWSVWNETMFHMNSLPPAPIPPLSPPDDANIPSSPAQTLSWPSGGADSEGDTITYYWYVDVDNPPSAPYHANGSTTGTSSGPFSTSPATDYYWYVNATDGWEWNTTIIWNFTTSAFTNEPPKARNLTVQGYFDGTAGIMHITDHTPDLNWSFFDPDAGDTQQEYDLRIGTALGLSDMWATGPLTGAIYTEIYSGLPLLDGVDYWFGIRVYDGNTWSTWNETQFHMNSLPPAPIPPLNPPDDSSIPSNPAQILSWTSSGTDSEGDVVMYYWYVDVDNSPSDPYLANGSTTGTSSATFATSPGNNYYWYVNATDGWEWNATIIWNFTTEGVANNRPEARGLTVQGFGVGTNGIVHITDHTPVLSWSFFDLDGGDVQQQYEIRIGTASGISDMWAPGPQIGAATTEVYAGLPLLDGTDYWFGVRVYDSFEWGLWNETMFYMNSISEAQTLTVQGFAEVTIEILHITDHTPDLGWKFFDSDSGDIQQEFEVRVGTSSGLSNMWSSGPQSGPINTVTYSGLTLIDGTDYWFGIRIYDGYEWSLWNETMFHLNSLEAQEITVQSFSEGTIGIDHITDHTPYLNWSYWDSEGGDSQQQYEVRVGSASGLSDLWAPGQQVGAIYSVTYGGLALLDGVDYWFGVRIYDGYEWSTWNETKFHLNSLEPQDLTVQGFASGTNESMHITDHTPDLGWTFWDNEGDPQQQYELRIGTGSGLSNMWAYGPQIGSTTTETYAGLALLDGTDYWFGIRIHDGYEWSFWNETKFHVNSLEARSLTVQGFATGSNGIMHITDHTPDLGWTLWDKEGDTQQQYEVRVGTSSGLSDMWASGAQTGAANIATYSGLPLIDGTDYWFGVRINDGYEWSNWNDTMFHMNSLPPAPIPPLNPPDDSIIPYSSVQELNWSFGGSDSEGDNITYYWYVDVDTIPTLPYLANGSTTGTSSAPFSTSMDTEYYWYVNATDGWEWNSSLIWNFTTAPPPNKPPEARNLRVMDFTTGSSEIMHITDHTPDFKWSFFDLDEDEQQSFEVRVLTKPDQKDIWAPEPQIGTEDGITYSGTPLQDGSVYWFGVRVYDGSDWSQWEEIQFAMNALPVIQNLSIDGFSKGSPEIMYISITEPELGGSYMDIDGGEGYLYEIRVGTASGLSDMWAFGPNEGVFEGVTYEGDSLVFGTDYWYGLRIYDGFEWSEWKEIQFHTNSPPELQWTDESNYETSGVYPLTGNTSTVFLFKIKYYDLDNNSPASGYPKLHIKKNEIEIDSSPFIMNHESGENSTGAIYYYSITLQPGNDYSYFFTASDEPGDFADPIPDQSGPEVMLDSQIVKPPTNITVSTSSERGELIISWDPSAEEDIAGYLIYRSTVPFSTINESDYELIAAVDASITSFTDTDLENKKTYYYMIRALDKSGNKSPYSEKVQVDTEFESRDEEEPFSLIWILLLVLSVVIVVILIFIFVWNKKSKEKESPQEEDEQSSIIEGDYTIMQPEEENLPPPEDEEEPKS